MIVGETTVDIRFTATSFNVYYLLRNGPNKKPIKAFPPGLRVRYPAYHDRPSALPTDRFADVGW